MMRSHTRILVGILILTAAAGPQVSMEEDVSGQKADSIQAAGIQKELNDLLAWSIG